VEKIFESLNADGSDWSKKQLAVLSRMSPTSLHVTMRQNELEKPKRRTDLNEGKYLCLNAIRRRLIRFLRKKRL